MKLYELKRDTWFTLDGERYQFKNLDGRYSICLDEEGKIRHIAAYAPVEVEEENEL